MIDPLLETWTLTVRTRTESTVLPDGCCDFIGKWARGKPPNWFLTPVDGSARRVSLAEGDSLLGFRLQPGVLIDRASLLKYSDEFARDTTIVATRLRETCSVSSNIRSALDALASSETVTEAAQRVGVRSRTLQRLLMHATGHTPQFWLQLARIRRAARKVGQARSLVELAMDVGFADQAHMTRQFRRWFDVTPVQFASNTEMQFVIHQLGYD